MALEIEKKFLVKNRERSLELLKAEYGEPETQVKSGFWWCSNYPATTPFLTVTTPKIQKNIVAGIKDIADFMLTPEDFQYVRLRVLNNNIFIITFKTKSLVKGTEQNIEFEYEVTKPIFTKILDYLKVVGFVYYANIKNTLCFKSKDFSIEVSSFNDVKDSYAEIELVGNNENILHLRLNKFLTKFKEYPFKPETRSYAEISAKENLPRLKTLKLVQYSQDAVKELEKILLENKNDK